MENRKLVEFLVILFISPLMAFNGNNVADDPILLNLLGEYKSSFYCDEKVTEMTYEEANKLLGKGLVLNKSSLVLFTDTLSNITYESNKVSTLDYLRLYKPSVCFGKMNLLFGDSICVLTTKSPENDFHTPIDIIIIEKYLVVNYGGYFYFFDKKVHSAIHPH